MNSGSILRRSQRSWLWLLRVDEVHEVRPSSTHCSQRLTQARRMVDTDSLAPSESVSVFGGEDGAAGSIAPSASISQIGTTSKQPSPEYIKQAARPPSLLPAGPKRPKLLVTDLNNCLLARRSRARRDGHTPQPRPYLSTFLSYLAKSDWSLMVWSSSSASAFPFEQVKLTARRAIQRRSDDSRHRSAIVRGDARHATVSPRRRLDSSPSRSQ